MYLKRTKKAVDKNYFGPFVSSEAVKKSIKEIQKIYKVRNILNQIEKLVPHPQFAVELGFSILKKEPPNS